jgi:BlaI family penicillinase repressor
MRNIPRISEAEWEVMKLLWAADSPVAAADVIDALGERTGWKPKTVKSLISRLVKKKALGFEQDGRTYRYFPLVAEEECVRAESDSFLDRVFGGALQPMLVHFLDEKRLTPGEIAELKRILDERGR